MRALVLLTPLLLVAFAACMDKSEDAKNPNKVDLYDNYFAPTEKTVAKGTTLDFENEGKRDHTFTVHHPPAPANQTVADKVLHAGDETSFTFTDPGVYHVWCRYHGTMLGGMHMNVTVPA